MKIGVLSDFTAANTVYRAVPVVRLSALGHPIVLDEDGERAAHPNLRGCEVVHIYRYHARSTQQLARTLRDLGVGVVWDVDDDLGAVPENTPGRVRRGALHEQDRMRSVRAMAGLAHVVTTPSEPLADLYRSYGADCVRVVPNFIPDDFVGLRRPHEGVVVGWIAAGEHYHDLEQLGLNETMRRLLDAHDDLRIASIGVGFDLPADRYSHRVLIQPAELPEHIASWDIGIAPIDDVAFNRARSDVKIKEYAAVGTPWLASPIGPYAGYGEKQGGRLVRDDEWFDALDRLVRRERERRKLAKRAVAWGRSQTVSRNLRAWEAALAEAYRRARAG